MPRNRDPDPEKYCLWCNQRLERNRYGVRLEDLGVFKRRKFCSISFGTHFQHATDPPTAAAGRKRAQKFTGGHCEACRYSQDLSVHHIDENPMNNEAENLQTLCAHCHGFWHAAAKRAGVIKPGRMPAIFPGEAKPQ